MSPPGRLLGPKLWGKEAIGAINSRLGDTCDIKESHLYPVRHDPSLVATTGTL